MNISVNSLTIYGGELIAGGGFTIAGGVSANRIARWNTTVWAPLGSGMSSGSVRALTVYGGELIAGGNFTNAGGVSVNNIAKWNGSSWSALGSGTNNTVYCLIAFNGALIAGGDFTAAGGVPASYIARWNGSAWMPIGSGLNNVPRAFTSFNSELIAGGYFTTAGGVSANYIAKWDGVVGVNVITENIPDRFSLSQNYPNPFNPVTSFKFQIPGLSSVKITIYDIPGKEVETLVNEELKPGIYEVEWDGTSFSSGVYYYRLEALEFIVTKKMILLK